MDPVTLIVTALAAGAATALQEGVSAAQALMRLVVDAAGSAARKYQVVGHAWQGVQVGGSQTPLPGLGPLTAWHG
jgi:hypothetical protein